MLMAVTIGVVLGTEARLGGGSTNIRSPSCLEKHCCEGVQRNQEEMKEAVESERMGGRHG